MRLGGYRYYKGKEVNVSGAFDTNLAEKIIFAVIISASIVFFFINFFPLYSELNTNNYFDTKRFLLALASFIPPFLFAGYLVIKYVVIRKTPLLKASYDIEIKNDDVNITNYKDEIINTEKKNR